MTVAVNPIEKKDSGLKDIVSALDVAARIYGVKVDSDKADALIEQNKLKAADEAAKQNTADINHINQTYKPVPIGTPGSIDRKNIIIPKGFSLPEDQTFMPIAVANQQSSQGMETTRINDAKTRELSQNYERASDETKKITDAWQTLDNSQKKSHGRAADDTSLIFNYFRVANPGAVVREYENEITINGTRSSNDYLNSLYAQVKNGHQSLTDTQREDLVNSARGMTYGHLQNQKDIDQEYITKSSIEGVDPNKIISPRFQKLNDEFEKSFAAQNENVAKQNQPLPGVDPELDALLTAKKARQQGKAGGTASNNRIPLR